MARIAVWVGSSWTKYADFSTEKRFFTASIAGVGFKHGISYWPTQSNEYITRLSFRLFSADECLLHLALFRKTIEQARQMLGDDGADDPARQETWMNGLCPIAEVMASGDYFAIDTESASGKEECPIVYLDHEYYFSGWLDSEEVEVVASDVIELVKTVLEDPLKYLDSYWTGGDPYDQWFPESVSFSN